ncbi:OmpP1/FadL family transporter [Uruburuella testudinis]|uniref:OmpP1/FadL family transporter n=1 Tax=Uruburuella testudinis TaxID=1282863 RepID=A0ABY4DTY1_9NEIS|nr:OmpP1/FadL family transporter [Uruburuella testudinis]UOO82140.1 OmpP1/FadL family transporter [Uruburuella testudinis]
MKPIHTRRIKQSALIISTALLAQSAWASGYHFGTQSVSSQSTANSSSAEAADPSTIFYNPAGLTKLEGTQATINLNIVAPNVKYSDGEAKYPPGGGTDPQENVQGSTSGKITDDVVFAPHIYASHQLNDKITVGLGTYVPFGSGTEYDHDSVLRYNLNELGLQTLAIQPTVAYKLNERHSFAVGFVAQHTTAELRQYANFGPAVVSSLGSSAAQIGAGLTQIDTGLTQLNAGISQLEAGIAATEAAGGDASALQTQLAGLQTQQAALTQQQATLTAQQAAVDDALASATAASPVGNGAADGYAKVKGDDWGFGYNLAWLWDINDRARVGVNYRSKIKHTLKGDGEWHLVGNAFNDPVLGSTIQQGIRDRGYVEKEDASVKITTPESLSVHGMYKVNPQWNVFGDVTWTRHSRFNQANLMWGNTKQVAADDQGNNTSNVTRLTPNWRNTYKVSLGASYQYSEPLQLRAGIAYDQSPVKNANYRMSTLPDNDRIWLSLGAKYDINRQHSINVAYSHLFIKKATANVNGYCGGSSATEVACVSSKTNGSANFKSSANILGLQYTYKF